MTAAPGADREQLATKADLDTVIATLEARLTTLSGSIPPAPELACTPAHRALSSQYRSPLARECVALSLSHRGRG